MNGSNVSEKEIGRGMPGITNREGNKMFERRFYEKI